MFFKGLRVLGRCTCGQGFVKCNGIAVTRSAHQEHRKRCDTVANVGAFGFARLAAVEVEHVVDDLEGDADLLAKLPQRFANLNRCARDHRTGKCA